MGKINKFILWLSFIFLLFSFWNRNAISNHIILSPEMFNEPQQYQIIKAPFLATFNDVHYKISPLYSYDLYGLVVSYRFHNSDTGLHKRWNDHLNVADVCIVWRNSAKNPLLNKIDFWNGQFSCRLQTDNRRAWAFFNMDQLSNNHLISDDGFIRNAIKDLKVGDQVHIKGWLSNYGVDGQAGVRGTSTVRTDTGNGACETIYVNQFEIIRAYNNPWRFVMYLSLIVFIIVFIVYFITPHKRRTH